MRIRIPNTGYPVERVAGGMLDAQPADPLRLRDRVDPGHSAPDAYRGAAHQVRVRTPAQRTD